MCAVAVFIMLRVREMHLTYAKISTSMVEKNTTNVVSLSSKKIMCSECWGCHAITLRLYNDMANGVHKVIRKKKLFL